MHKDSALARRLINDSSLPGKIVQLALEYQVEGVELDFEKIPDEEWEAYVTFIDKLGAMLASQDIALRVRSEMVPNRSTADFICGAVRMVRQ